MSELRKLLVANRGEIARRVMRTCREMGIRTVAVYSEPDRDAPFVREADEAVALGGDAPATSYLRGDAIVGAARRTGADAVHPGYGFLSENAAFARLCRETGLVFVGPPSEAIEAMGSKLEARRRMGAAGVPVVPGRELASDDARTLEAAAAELGLPVLVKAAAGGGGRGMRVVRARGELAAAVASAQREAEAAFGDGTVYLERWLRGARHVEVQILGDSHGNLIHLGERECSVQRRHQKLLEESPCPGLDAALRAALCDAALRAGRAVRYESAGTVEFLLLPDGTFYFLEMNTRLQVEHPVTEAVTGLDLVRLQLQVARGERLPALDAAPQGHAIEVRLYAEDPERDFLPVAGRLHRLAFPSGVRVDATLDAEGGEVGVHYDSMLAKVIASAPTRTEAAAGLARALEEAEIHGLRTNRELLVRVLRSPDFLEERVDTAFLERHPPAELGRPLADARADRLHAVAAALAAQAQRRASARVLGAAPSGWRNNPSAPQRAAFDGPSGPVEVAYRFGRGGLELRVDGEALAEPRLHLCTPDRVELAVEGVRRTYRVHRVGDRAFVQSALGPSELRERPRFPEPAPETLPGSLVAPLPGVVRKVLAKPGDTVRAGAVLLVLEAMKTEHEIVAPTAGRVVEIHARPGETVDAGHLLAVLEEG